MGIINKQEFCLVCNKNKCKKNTLICTDKDCQKIFLGKVIEYRRELEKKINGNI